MMSQDNKTTWKNVIDLAEPDEIDAVRYIIKDFLNTIKDNPLFKEYREIEPFILKEIKKPEYNNMSLDDLLLYEYKDENNTVKENGLFMLAYNNALQEYKSKVLEKANKQLVEKVDFNLDKPSQYIWNGITTADVDGQLNFLFDTLNKPLETATAVFSIGFSDLEDNKNIVYSKTLEPYEKRIHTIISSFYSNNLEMFTIPMIYKMLGGKGNPDNSSTEKIKNALTKMRFTRLYIDNRYEAANSNYPLFNISGTYDGYLLPLESVTNVKLNGTSVPDVFHFLREPPLTQYAREHKQITTLKKEVICFPLSNTNTNILIEDYLIDRIAVMKNNPQFEKKILFTSLFEATNTTTKQARYKALDKATKCMDHLANEKIKYIKSYEKTETAFDKIAF